MASTIKVKRSAVAGKSPTTGNLEVGEIALNTKDGRLYSKGTMVFEVGANNHSLFVGTGGATFANGAYALPTADGSADQILKTNGSGTLSFADATSAGSIAFFEYDGTQDNIPLDVGFPTDALGNTNSYIAATAATERSSLANTNAFIATKLNSSSYTAADVKVKAALANTNAYIATKTTESTALARLANTNLYIASIIDGQTFTGDVFVGSNKFGGDATDYLKYYDNTYLDVYINDVNQFRFENDGDFHANGDIVAYSTTVSDERLKEDITVVDGALNKINQLRGVTFKYKTDGKVSAGVIAQDIEKVLPEAVSEKTLPLKTNDDVKYKVVHYDAVTGLLVQALKEATAKIETLESRVSSLENN